MTRYFNIVSNKTINLGHPCNSRPKRIDRCLAAFNVSQNNAVNGTEAPMNSRPAFILRRRALKTSMRQAGWLSQLFADFGAHEVEEEHQVQKPLHDVGELVAGGKAPEEDRRQQQHCRQSERPGPAQ